MRCKYVNPALVATLVSMFTLSCGDSSKQSGGGKAGRKPSEAPAKPPVEPSPSAGPTTPAPAGPEFKTHAAVSIPLYDGPGKTSTLFQKAKALGKPYTVFQLSGVLCETCKVDSPKVQAELKNLDVGRIVIFPNKLGEFQETDYKRFVDTYCLSAPRMVDSDLKLLKSIRQNESQFFGLYLIVRASDGKAVVLNNDNAHTQIVSVVKSIK